MKIIAIGKIKPLFSLVFALSLSLEQNLPLMPDIFLVINEKHLLWPWVLYPPVGLARESRSWSIGVHVLLESVVSVLCYQQAHR